MTMRLAWIFVTALCLAACEPPMNSGLQFEQTAQDRVEHGRRISAVLGCTDCHGTNLTGVDWSMPDYGRLWTANLTRAVSGYTDQQLERIIRTGALPDRDMWEMPSHLFTELSPEDMAAVIAFLRSHPPSGDVHPPPTFGPAAQREITAGQWISARARVSREGALWPPDAGSEHARGRYIVRATCAECHGMDLRGTPPPIPGDQARPDARIAAAYDAPSFTRFMRTGVATGDRDLGLMSQVARSRYRHFRDAEINEVHRYLQAVADNDP